MKILKIATQILGIAILIPVVALATLRIENSNDDGASVVFPGGELVSGELYTGPEPDWSFTDNIDTIELQLFDPISSRRIWILESEGKIYVESGYMNSFLGRLWKQWAVDADQGDGRAVIRIDDTRYERQLVRVEQGPELEGVAAKMASKYNSPTTRESIEDGNTWIFELAPPGG
jgi:hypothetical protein